ncbi:MAG: hypothetical protein H7Y43_12735, partial [Akkermansiaceae bacterium]|nr:hypothetical protein [Verrucomicrobiales bacterium]
MKTTLPILLLLFLVSCSQPKPSPTFAESEPSQAGPLAVAEPLATEPPPAIVAPPAEVVPPEVVNNPTAVAAAPDAVPEPNAPGAPAIRPTPTPAAVPAAADSGEQMLAAGMIDFRNAPLDQVLTVYSELVNRTMLRPATLPAPQVTLTTRTALSKTEAIQALEAVLGLNGISTVNVGDKFVKVVAQPQVVQEGGETDTRKAADLPQFGPFITHVVQLKYVKPSEIVPALQPFAKMNSILPIDASGI